MHQHDVVQVRQAQRGLLRGCMREGSDVDVGGGGGRRGGMAVPGPTPRESCAARAPWTTIAERPPYCKRAHRPCFTDASRLRLGTVVRGLI